jgi:hypothetical protein
MPNREVTIAGGPNNTKAMVTGQQELLVKVSSSSPGAFTPSGIVKTASIERPSNTSGVVSGVNSVSIANVGTTDGVIEGVILKAGEIVNFDAGAANTLASLSYDAAGTTFLITTIS